MTLDDRGYPTGEIGYDVIAADILRQGDPRWGKRTIGRSASTTIGAAGCVLTSVAMACRVLGVRAGATPLDCQARGVQRPGVWADGAAGCVVPELARAQGLTVGEDIPGAGAAAPTQPLRKLILEALDAGGVALVCVDTDRATGGDVTGEHWCLATEADSDTLWICDPATGGLERIVLRTLSGSVRWGKAKTKAYSVVRAVSLFR